MADNYPQLSGPKRPVNPALIVGAGCCGCLVLMVPIIAAVLFPVFAQAREAARASACLSNEKQQCLAILMYAQDYDESLPSAKQWMPAASPYLKDPSLFQCPTVKNTNGSQVSLDYGYAYNSSLSSRNLGMALAPAATVMVFESSSLGPGAYDAFTSYPNPGRHLRRDNIGFLDGHVKATSIEQIGVLQQTMKRTKLFGNSPNK